MVPLPEADRSVELWIAIEPADSEPVLEMDGVLTVTAVPPVREPALVKLPDAFMVAEEAPETEPLLTTVGAVTNSAAPPDRDCVLPALTVTEAPEKLTELEEL